MDPFKHDLTSQPTNHTSEELMNLLQRVPPSNYLEEWSKSLAHKEEESVLDQTPIIVFRLYQEWLALKSQCLKEVSEERPVHTIPHRTNEVFTGLVNLSGELYLCMNLACLLGINQEASQKSLSYRRLIAIQSEADFWVFPVHEVDNLYLITSNQITEVPSTISHSLNHRYQGIIYLQDKTIGFLDEQKLFRDIRGCF